MQLLDEILSIVKSGPFNKTDIQNVILANAIEKNDTHLIKSSLSSKKCWADNEAIVCLTN